MASDSNLQDRQLSVELLSSIFENCQSGRLNSSILMNVMYSDNFCIHTITLLYTVHRLGGRRVRTPSFVRHFPFTGQSVGLRKRCTECDRVSYITQSTTGCDQQQWSAMINKAHGQLLAKAPFETSLYQSIKLNLIPFNFAVCASVSKALLSKQYRCWRLASESLEVTTLTKNRFVHIMDFHTIAISSSGIVVQTLCQIRFMGTKRLLLSTF